MVRTTINCIPNDKSGFELIIFAAMRVVKEVPHPELKITIFQWNNRYLVKFEMGLLEQTYKIPEYDVASEQEVVEMIDENFVVDVKKIFQDMNGKLNDSLFRLHQ